MINLGWDFPSLANCHLNLRSMTEFFPCLQNTQLLWVSGSSGCKTLQGFSRRFFAAPEANTDCGSTGLSFLEQYPFTPKVRQSVTVSCHQTFPWLPQLNYSLMHFQRRMKRKCHPENDHDWKTTLSTFKGKLRWMFCKWLFQRDVSNSHKLLHISVKLFR